MFALTLAVLGFMYSPNLSMHFHYPAGHPPSFLFKSMKNLTAEWVFIKFNSLTAGHENIRAGFKCSQCYARVNTMR
jgi:hypothetical protein